MKLSNLFVSIFCLLTLILMPACAPGPATAIPTEPATAQPTPNVQATVDAVVEATTAAGQANPTELATEQPTPNVQATVDAVVEATTAAGQAVQATVDSAVQATVAALPPTATPVPPVDATTLSEEELAALIDAAVDEAVAASDDYAAATTQATADGSVSNEEVEAVEVYLYGVEQAVAYADELIGIYSELYAETAEEAVALLVEMEQDLEAIIASTAQTAAILEQGAEAASAAVEQLNAAAQQAATTAMEMQQQREQWMGTVQAQIEDRAAWAQEFLANDVATDRVGATRQVYDYLDAVRGALQDGQVTQLELGQIAQLGANASAAAEAHGGPQLQGVSEEIAHLTDQLARGQWPQASAGLGGFDASLPALPGRP
jgi:hypothetical protein